MRTRVVDLNARAGDEIFHCARNDHFARGRLAHNARRKVNGDSLNIRFRPL